MEGNDEKEIVPPQVEGSKKDIEHQVQTQDENDARKLFNIARNRLLSVNHWEDFSSPARFGLVDEAGKELTRTVEKGDYFKIAIGAPGPNEGDGYDWVFVEEIDDNSNPNGHEEHLALRARPSRNPQAKENDDTAHFFDDVATSSFVVSRSGTTVKAAVYGRNEKPNTQTSDTIDKVRNAVVGATAILGLSNIEWNSLVKGLLNTHANP